MGAGECVFCGIVAGTMPSVKIHEDERTLTFMDIFPVAPGHTLIIPKAHCANLFEADPEDLAAVARRAGLTARALRAALAPDGLAVAQLNGAAAGQTVFHYHVHLVPRREGDPFTLHGRGRADDGELARLAAAVAAALEG